MASFTSTSTGAWAPASTLLELAIVEGDGGVDGDIEGDLEPVEGRLVVLHRHRH